MYVTMFIIATLRENGYYRCRTLRMDRQFYRDHAIKFPRWQHPAVWRGAMFTVLGTTCFLL